MLLALCEGNLPVTGGFPSQRTVTQRFNFLSAFEQTVIWDVGDLRRNSVHYDVTVIHLYSCHYVVHRSLNTISEIVQTKMFLLHYNERYRIFGLQIYLIPGGLIDNMSAWTRWVFSAKPLPEQCWGRYLAHMYTTSHQWVNFKHFMRYIRSI